MVARTVKVSLLLLVGLLAVGCEIPSQMVWSPDGSRAVYLSTVHDKSRAVVMDEEGKIVSELGLSTGGFAWSADSQRLYYATAGPKPQGKPPFEQGKDWRATVPGQKTSDEAAKNSDEQEIQLISVWDHGQITPLFWIDPEMVWHMQLSPDQKWLAVIAFHAKPHELTELYVFSLETERLYHLSTGCSKGIAFTGPHRLALVEPNQLYEGKPSDLGELVEVELDEAVEKPQRQSLLAVLMPLTPWLQPVGEDLLFTSYQFTFPGPLPEKNPEESYTFKLFRYNRLEKSAKVVAEDVSDLFMPSPDGKLVLLGRMIPAQGDEELKVQLAVVETVNGKLHLLREQPETVSGQGPSAGAAYPAWRGNDQIVYTTPEAGVEKEDRVYKDLTLYRLTRDFKLEPIRKLSQGWELEMKPSYKK